MKPVAVVPDEPEPDPEPEIEVDDLIDTSEPPPPPQVCIVKIHPQTIVPSGKKLCLLLHRLMFHGLLLNHRYSWWLSGQGS